MPKVMNYEKTKKKLNEINKCNIYNFIKNIFSVYNENYHKVICILGFKIKFKIKFDKPIDLVYTWVDGNDENWQKEKLKWQKEYGIESGDEVNPCRFIDNEELRYSLRSVAKNAPWINHIYIVTNGQIPKWLDTSHPKITIVKHEEIMPKEALPTFNSDAIETCLMNIPNLSEYFLYANDDMFINKPVSPDYFFDKSRNPIIRLKKYNWEQEKINSCTYCTNIIFNAELINNKYNKYYPFESSHNICPYSKTLLSECKKEFKTYFDKTCLSKFRYKYSIQRTIFDYYTMVQGACILKTNIEKDNLHIGLWSKNSIIKAFSENNPSLTCINDDEWTHPDNRGRLKSVLGYIFPNVQPWEIPQKFDIKPIFDQRESFTIVFAPDNKFAKYFGVALKSLITHSEVRFKYDIVVFESDISSKNKKLLYEMLPPNFSLRFFDISEFIAEKFPEISLKSKNYWSISMYYRIFIPLLMEAYEKVLYLDSDVCINHSLTELYNIDFDDKEVIAVIDTISPILYRKPERLNYMREILKLINPENYFNSGMLLFNIKKIDKDKYANKIIKNFQICDLLYPDQDILNLIFENEIKLIAPKWNYLYGECEWGPQFLNFIGGEYKKNFLEARDNPYIIHYTSPRKPWDKPSAEYADIWWKYARKTPFYEEIIYENANQSGVVTNNTLKNIVQKRKIYYSYYRCKLLSYITFGKTKEHYISKRNNLKTQIRCIREFSKN